MFGIFANGVAGQFALYLILNNDQRTRRFADTKYFGSLIKQRSLHLRTYGTHQRCPKDVVVFTDQAGVAVDGLSRHSLIIVP
ncbi:MAG: hypothetical protein R2788_11050 [Saprospiraceae bacterium]